MSSAARPTLGRTSSRSITRPWGLDPVELAALICFAALSLAVLVPLLLKGRPLSGADGLFPADQLQYFAWIREASEHVLVGNRFDLAPSSRAFAHPGFLMSGAVHAATGLSIPVAYLLWKPVAVVLLFVGFLRYVRSLLPAGGQRHVALLLALFAVMPATALVAWSGWGGNLRQYTFEFISGEMWTGQYLWGYLMTAIAVGLMPLVLLATESFRSGGSRRSLWLAAAGTLLIAWLQPWQGVTVALVVVAAEAWSARREGRRPIWSLAVVPAAIALPGVYYFVLGQVDDAWKLAAEANAAGAQPEWSWPWWAIVLTVAPLAVPAAFAYRLPARGWQDRALRAWPLAALVVFVAPGLTFPYHSFQGLALPLSILAVQAVAPLRPGRGLVVAALVLLIVPGTARKLEAVAGNVRSGEHPYFIESGDAAAMVALERDPRRGGVLSTFYAGQFVPYTSGRKVWVGALSWSPDFAQRRSQANELFSGRMRGAQALEFVRSTRARFVYVNCALSVDLVPVLRPLTESVRRFGCATVLNLRPRPEMAAAAGSADD